MCDSTEVSPDPDSIEASPGLDFRKPGPGSSLDSSYVGTNKNQSGGPGKSWEKSHDQKMPMYLSNN